MMKSGISFYLFVYRKIHNSLLVLQEYNFWGYPVTNKVLTPRPHENSKRERKKEKGKLKLGKIEGDTEWRNKNNKGRKMNGRDAESSLFFHPSMIPHFLGF